MATQASPLISPEEYFELERKSVDRHEYLGGRIFAMAGGSEPHSIISLNIGAQLNIQLQDQPCTAYNGEMRISTHENHHYTYADAAVACGSQINNETLLNPVFIVEVLSKSTESYDRGKKFLRYRRIPSFREYLLVAQKQILVEQYVKTENRRTTWVMTEYTSLEDAVDLVTIPVRLRLSDLYRKVSFPHY